MPHGILLLGLLCLPQEKPPSDAEVREVLRKVRDGMAADRLKEESQALQLAQAAEAARREGRVLEAAVLARRAMRQFPESLPLRRLVRTLEAEEAVVKRQTTNLATARRRLDEALDAAQKLYRQGDTQLARDLAEAVLTAAERFPAGAEVLPAVLRAEAFLKEPSRPPSADEPAAEKLPLAPDNRPPPPPAPPPPLNVPSRKLLARLMTVDWQQVTLLEALNQIAAETGVQLRIDPTLARLRVFEAQRLTFQGQQQPAERLLRQVMTQIGTDYVPMTNGQVYVTTKQEALAMILERRTPPGPVPTRPPVRSVASGPERIPEPQEDAPAYLSSGRAFLAHIEELLQPAPVQGRP